MHDEREYGIEAGAKAPTGKHTFLPLEGVSFGPGAIAELGPELERLGCSRALVVTGKTIAGETDLIARLEAVLGPKLAGVFAASGQHVPRASVLAAADAAREAGADIIVSLGGGSPCDTAKLAALAVAAEVTTVEQLADYRIGYHSGDDADAGPARPIPEHPLPLIAIATTLSAGEFNGWAGSLAVSGAVKETFGAPQLTPRLVVLDPELTLATPDWLWAATGMRAMDHAVESVYSRDHHPFGDALCLHAAGILYRSLEQWRVDRDDLAARGRSQVAAWMSIAALTSVQTGLSHAIGLQLGARCDVPHGVTSAILLPEVMEFNLPDSADRQALIAAAMGVGAGEDDVADAGAAIAALRQLVTKMGVEDRLRDWGVGEDDLEPIAAATATTPANPRAVDSPTQIVELLRRVY